MPLDWDQTAHRKALHHRSHNQGSCKTDNRLQYCHIYRTHLAASLSLPFVFSFIVNNSPSPHLDLHPDTIALWRGCTWRVVTVRNQYVNAGEILGRHSSQIIKPLSAGSNANLTGRTLANWRQLQQMPVIFSLVKSSSIKSIFIRSL